MFFILFQRYELSCHYILNYEEFPYLTYSGGYLLLINSLTFLYFTFIHERHFFWMFFLFIFVFWSCFFHFWLYVFFFNMLAINWIIVALYVILIFPCFFQLYYIFLAFNSLNMMYLSPKLICIYSAWC